VVGISPDLTGNARFGQQTRHLSTFRDLILSYGTVPTMHGWRGPGPFSPIMPKQRYVHLAALVLAGLSFPLGRAAESSPDRVAAKSTFLFP
jgi:hypothetical protein